MITRSRKRLKTALLWLDKMPTEVRDKIASMVSNDGKYNDDAISLAHTSDIQRRAVLASFPTSATYDLYRLNLTNAWADLLAGHMHQVTIAPAHGGNLSITPFHRSLIVRMLQAPQLERAELPGVKAFLIALRGAKALTSLQVTGGASCQRTLRCTLEQLGPFLSKLALTCNQCGTLGEYEINRQNCLANMFRHGSWSALTRFCPNLQHISLDCGSMAPSTISTLVNGLPLLTTAEFSSSLHCQLLLSESDVIALRRLDSVALGDVSGGLHEIGRIGSPIVQVRDFSEMTSDAVKELVHCPRVSSLRARVTVEGMKTLTTDVVQHLPRLSELQLLLGYRNTFGEIQDAANEALKIIRILNLLESVSVFARIAEDAWLSPIEQMDRVRTAVAGDGGTAAVSHRGDRFVICMIQVDGA